MIKWSIYPLIMLLFMTLAYGEMCSSEIEITSNCTMLTPSLSCVDYNYNIYNITGSIMENGSLTNLNSTIYYFNFTLTQGHYIVELCDGSTREIKVEADKEDKKMLFFGLMLIPLIFGAFLLWGASSLGEEHPALKIALFLISPVFIFLSMHIGLIGVIETYPNSALQDIVGSSVYWFGAIFGMLITYFIIYAFYIYTRKAGGEDERLEY